MCATALLAIFSAVVFLLSLPRTLAGMNWLGLISAVFIGLCGFLAMVGAGANPVPGRVLAATVSTSFYQAFLAITGPVSSWFLSRAIAVYSRPHQVFSYAGTIVLPV